MGLLVRKRLGEPLGSVSDGYQHLGRLDPEPRVSRVAAAWKTVAAWLNSVLQGIAVDSPAITQRAARCRWRLLSTSWENLGPSQGTVELQEWARSLSQLQLMDGTCLLCLPTVANNAARKVAAEDQRRVNNSWRSWLQEGPGQGIGRQHRFSRTSLGWVPTKVAVPHTDNDGDAHCSIVDDCDLISAADLLDARTVELPFHAQQAVDAEANKWAFEWMVGSSSPLPICPTGLGEPLPTPCVDAAVDACKSFSSSTGPGGINCTRGPLLGAHVLRSQRYSGFSFLPSYSVAGQA